MTKEEIVQSVLKKKKETLASIQEDVKIHSSAVDLDETDTLDPEDYSHQTEQGEVMAASQNQLALLQQEIALIESIDLSPKAKVSLGSLIQTDDAFLFIGIGFDHFSDEPYIHGVGKGSPIYNELIGKEEGHTFEFKGSTERIEHIY